MGGEEENFNVDIAFCLPKLLVYLLEERRDALVVENEWRS